MLNCFNRPDKALIDHQSLQELLNEIISPQLEQIGLQKARNNVWHEATSKEIRRGFSYMFLKGAAGTFTWGVNLEFLPTLSNGRIVYHKSPKRYLHHLFEWTDEYANSFFGGELTGGVTTHFGLHKAKNSISTLFEKYNKRIKSFFDTGSSITDLIKIAEKQVTIGKHYRLHFPTPEYVLAFLYAKGNRMHEATEIFDAMSEDEFNGDKELKQKVRSRLLLCESR